MRFNLILISISLLSALYFSVPWKSRPVTTQVAPGINEIISALNWYRRVQTWQKWQAFRTFKNHGATKDNQGCSNTNTSYTSHVAPQQPDRGVKTNQPAMGWKKLAHQENMHLLKKTTVMLQKPQSRTRWTNLCLWRQICDWRSVGGRAFLWRDFTNARMGYIRRAEGESPLSIPEALGSDWWTGLIWLAGLSGVTGASAACSWA